MDRICLFIFVLSAAGFVIGVILALAEKSDANDLYITAKTEFADFHVKSNGNFRGGVYLVYSKAS